MSDTDANARLEIVETHLIDHAGSLEELTRTVLRLERQIQEQAETIKRLEAQVRAGLQSPVARPEDESPPPHY